MGIFGVVVQTITFKRDKQGPTVQHGEIYPISWDRLMEKNFFNVKKNEVSYTQKFNSWEDGETKNRN